MQMDHGAMSGMSYGVAPAPSGMVSITCPAWRGASAMQSRRNADAGPAAVRRAVAAMAGMAGTCSPPSLEGQVGVDNVAMNADVAASTSRARASANGRRVLRYTDLQRAQTGSRIHGRPRATSCSI